LCGARAVGPPPAEIAMRSVSFSLLGGTVTVSDLRMTTRNTHLQVEKVVLLVRYWLTRPRRFGPGGLPEGRKPPQARLEVNLKGVNYIVMNNRCGRAQSPTLAPVPPRTAQHARAHACCGRVCTRSRVCPEVYVCQWWDFLGPVRCGPHTLPPPPPPPLLLPLVTRSPCPLLPPTCRPPHSWQLRLRRPPPNQAGAAGGGPA
jgi:hypothetical protein